MDSPKSVAAHIDQTSSSLDLDTCNNNNNNNDTKVLSAMESCSYSENDDQFDTDSIESHDLFDTDEFGSTKSMDRRLSSEAVDGTDKRISSHEVNDISDITEVLHREHDNLEEFNVNRDSIDEYDSAKENFDEDDDRARSDIDDEVEREERNDDDDDGNDDDREDPICDFLGKATDIVGLSIFVFVPISPHLSIRFM